MSVLEKLSLHSTVNTTFLKFLDVDIAIDCLRFVNHRLFEGLPQSIKTLCIRSNVLDKQRNTIFTKVKKLVLYSSGHKQSVSKKVIISKKQFPSLYELENFESPQVELIIDSDIFLTKIVTDYWNIQSIPVHSLHEITVLNLTASTVSQYLVTHLLSSNFQSSLKKLRLPINHIRGSQQKLKARFDVQELNLKKILCKFSSSLQDVTFEQCQGNNVVYCSIFQEVFEEHKFPNLVMFQYLADRNSFIYIPKPTKVTELKLFYKQMRCVKSTQKLVFPNLQKLRLEGTNKDIIAFLRIVGTPLSICAPNIQALNLYMSENNYNNGSSSSSSSSSNSMNNRNRNRNDDDNNNHYNDNNDDLCFEEMELLQRNIFNPLSDKATFHMLQNLTIECNGTAILISHKVSLKTLYFDTSNSENLENISLIQVQDCPSLEVLEIYKSSAVTTILSNLPSLGTFVCKTRKSFVHNWKYINSNHIHTLKIQVNEKMDLYYIVQLVHNSLFLESFDVTLHIYANELTNFLISIFTPELRARLKKLKMSGKFEDLTLGMMPFLEELIINHRENIYSIRNPKSLRFVLYDLPKLSKLDMYCSFIGTRTKKRRIIPFHIRHLPLCRDVFISSYFAVSLSGYCSKFLWDNESEINNDFYENYGDEDDSDEDDSDEDNSDGY